MKKAVEKKMKKVVVVNEKPLSVSVDGQGVRILRDGQIEMLFVQGVDQTDTESRVNVVSSIRMNKMGLLNLKKTIDNTLEKISASEKI